MTWQKNSFDYRIQPHAPSLSDGAVDALKRQLFFIYQNVTLPLRLKDYYLKKNHSNLTNKPM